MNLFLVHGNDEESDTQDVFESSTSEHDAWFQAC